MVDKRSEKQLEVRQDVSATIKKSSKLKNVSKTEVYLEPSRTSTLEFLAVGYFRKKALS